MAAMFLCGSVIVCIGQESAPSTEPSKLDQLTHFGVVIDNSGASRLALEKSVKLVSGFVNSDTGASEGFLITYSDSEKIRLRQDFTSDKLELRDAVENIYAESGGGALLDAIKLALDHLKSAAGGENPGFLLIVTSGEDRGSSTKIDDLIKQLKAAKVRLFIVGLADGKVETKHIDRLAKDAGAKKFVPVTADDMANLVETLLADVRR